jgi:hypothetical protein
MVGTDKSTSSCPALCRAIHDLLAVRNNKDVDGRDKPGHDGEKIVGRINRRLNAPSALQAGFLATIASLIPHRFHFFG